MKPELENVLEDCLKQMANGTSTVDECLARFPQYAQELRPLLLAANRLGQARAMRPPASFTMRGRAQLLDHMAAHPRHRWRLWLAGLAARPYRLAFCLAAVLFIFLAAATTVAQAALPGQFFYGWKRTSEGVWRTMHPDPLAADLALSERRVEELVRLAGSAETEQRARQGYQESLTILGDYAEPADQENIYHHLAHQKERLDQLGVAVPELDGLLGILATERLLPSPTIPTTHGPTPSATEGPESDPAPATELAPATQPAGTRLTTPAHGEELPLPVMTPPPISTELPPIRP